MLFTSIRRTLVLVPLILFATYMQSSAQSPVALPNTMTTLAGLSPQTTTAGSACPTRSSLTATDAYGDGCPAANATFGAAGRGGVAVDAYGNVFVTDDTINGGSGVVHMINPTTGIMTQIAGLGTVCAGKVDAAGDGCIAATQTIVKGQRGMGIDPYGNPILAGYSDNLVHVICRVASPLCAAAQVGTMQLVAGCSTGTGSNGTGGAGSDNVIAKTTSAVSCTAAKGEVYAPRGATADIYGNVYFADTSSNRWRVVLGPLTSAYFTGNNPLYAALGVYYSSVTAGYAYSVAGITATATTKGNSCSVTTNSVTYTGSALDTYGDGCPMEFASVATSSGYVNGVAVDAAGNMIFTDPTHGLRVFYVNSSGTAGAAMKAAIIANNPGVTPQAGFVYMLAGGGATAISTTPTLGTSTTVSDSTITKVTVSPQGHIYIGDSNKVLFYDINTGYIRTLITGSSNATVGTYCNGVSGQTSLSAYSDGCPASKSLFSNTNGLGVAVDTQGNLYLYDSASNASGMLVRKVLAQGFASQTVGTALTQTFLLHLPESVTATVTGATAALSATPDMTAGTPTCAQNADYSVDCTVAVTTTPTAPGQRSAALSVSMPSGTWTNALANLQLNGSVSGSLLVVDNASSTVSGTTTSLPPTTNSLGSGITVEGIATDGAGNGYMMDPSKGVMASIQGGAGGLVTSTLPTSPAQMAVDQLGDIFAVGSGTATIEELEVTGPPASAGAPPAFTTVYLNYTPVSGTATPTAVAVDSFGNVFVADKQGSTANTAIYRLAVAAGKVLAQTTVATGFTNPVSLAVDGSGNVYVADKGVPAVYKLTPGQTGAYTQTTLTSSVTPVSVATDPAGNVYVQDQATGKVIEIPLSGASPVTVLTGLSSPSALAVDNKGNVYSADTSQTSITKVVRNGYSFDFGTNESITFAGTLTNAGTLASTGSNPATNTTNFNVVAGSSNGCSFTSSVMGALSVGQACTLSATLVGNGSGSVADVLSYMPSASTVGTLTLNGTLQGVAVATTTSISASTPASPVYVASGTEATFTVTVTPASGATAPGGTVSVTVDGTTTTPTLTASGVNGVATVTISGLTAGTHSISATYVTNGTFTGSGSGSQSFTIAPITTSVNWTPGATTQQVSQAIGAGVLNATVSPGVSGTFSYTATPSGGSPGGIDASTYLAIGTYSLGVTFTPNDSVDYTTSTATAASYTVTKASTTATAGATTNVVAADGTGNFTTLSAALAALPVTGGTIYIAPGTYTGQNAISYPNVALRGLGGDATKVILTGEDGAFSSPFVYPGSSAGNANASGDQGSSTLDVAKSAYIGNQATTGNVQYTPNNFYAEYLTIQNTYNTSTTTTSTYSTASGSCADTGVSQTLQALYNSGKQCNSQALALWITADQAVLNNVNLISQQDTLYAGSQGCTGSTCTPARQYMWKGTITGDVDYVFGDAALVFDHTNFFTTWHGATATGTETIEAQNKKYMTGSSGDYLSGYICNGCTLMSQSTGMTYLYYGRPYGAYSTWIMLNSYVDQVNPVGWIEFSGQTNLPTSTYAEYNTRAYTDPAVGTTPYPAALFGGTVTPTGGSTGTGVSGTRETSSTNPGTIEASNAVHTTLTEAQAAQYYPVTFLGTSVPTQSYTGFTASWNPVNVLSTAVNNFAPSGNITLNSYGSSVTILGRPQTPGAGLIPTGTYQFLDGATVVASGSLDAAGEAYFTTSTLTTGTHSITMVYGGDANFNGSTSAAFTITVPAKPLIATTTTLTVTNPYSVYGGSVNGTVTVTPASGTDTPTGTVNFISGSNTLGSCTLSSGTCSFSLTGVGAGVQTMSASYAGDTSYAASASAGARITVARAVLQVTANNFTIVVGASLPTYTYTISGFVNGDTQGTATTGAPTLSSTASNSNTVGIYPITVTTGTLTAANYNFSYTNGYLYIQQTSQATAVATGDSRTVTEPTFPTVCATLTATLASVSDDISASVDATNTNPDGTRIQTALNNCSGTGQAVELSRDSSGNNAFLTGPLSMPSNVTLLVDPGVTVFFSRNAQDYDKVSGTHTCGTINNNSATGSCLPLIEVPKTSTNVAIMGYGKLDGRGGDTLINAIAPYTGYSWWQLSNAANGVGNQQNPRFFQMDSGSSNITLYKITLKNSPLFHVSTTGAVSNFTAWDVKVVTPTSSRNTDGIDPGNATNFTITRSWISDGDDNVAVGASGSAPAQNISVTNNHFFAGHGESIGSYTGAGASNILFDGNMAAGNSYANVGSALGSATDSNSTAIRIKSANDRGGLVTNIQYSNSCFLDHKSDVQFTPLYNTNSGTLTPNFQNILMQNLVFVNDYATASTGTLQFTGAVNGSTINPLTVTLDNVTFPSVLSSSNFVTTGTAGTETNAQITLGPGQVSSNFVSAWQGFAGSNGDTLTDNRTAASLLPPQCNFTYIAPELTGPNGLPQTIAYGQNATAVVILTPAVGGAAYPTGTITLTDAFNSSTTTVPLTGTSDTIGVPLTGLAVGTHTFTVTYSGDTNYPLPSGATYYTQAGPYVVTVNGGSLASTTTALSGVPSTISYGNTFAATATITGTNASGSVQFIVNGAVYAVSVVSNSGTATANISLPYSASAYSIYAVYSGDNSNAGSMSSTSSVTVTSAVTTTALAAASASGTLGHPVSLSATVSSAAGTATGSVIFTYTTATNATPTTIETSSLIGGVATVSASLPMGTNYVTAAYQGSGAYAASTSTSMTITVTAPTIVALPTAPLPLPYIVSTIGGGGLTPGSGIMACAGAVDKWGNGCQATSVGLTSGDDLRGVTADPFGNIYFTDISASLIRKISPTGTISNFAGRVTGTACVPTAATGCTPTLVSLSKPRGVGSDASGNIYIADYSQNKVYVVSTSGLMYLIAGTGTATSTGDGGAASAATVYAPRSAMGDSAGNIYIADTSGNKIRVVDNNGIIHTFAGTGTASSTGDGGLATSATISNPQGVMTDANLNVYIADSSGGRIRVVCVTCGTNSPLDALLAKLGVASPVNGYIYTLVGNGSTGVYAGATFPILGTSVSMSPQKMAMDTSNNIYISDGNGVVWFYDFRTGNIRPIASNAASVCSGASDSYGDGCPATQSKFGVGSGGGIGVGTDTLGNVYFTDGADGRIRKVSTGLQVGYVSVGQSPSEPVLFHFIPGDSPAASNAFTFSLPDWSLVSPSCTTNSDTTTDCTLTGTFAPALPGNRPASLTINTALGNTAYIGVVGRGYGAGATIDPARQSTFGSGLQVAGLTADSNGNIYVADAASKSILRYAAASIAQGASATPATLATLTSPSGVVVDPRGYIYAVDSSTGALTEISPAGTVSTLTTTGDKLAAITVDNLNNLYIADQTAKSIYLYNPITRVGHALSISGLATPSGLAIDPGGNLLITDPGVPAVYHYSLQTGTLGTVTMLASAPSAVVTDAAGDPVIADSATIYAVPVSAGSSPFTVTSLAPAGLAIDGAGNLYTGSPSGSIVKLTRTQANYTFATASASPASFNVLSSGSQALQLTSITQTDSSDYGLAFTATTDCTVNSSYAGTLASGGVCPLTATYTPTTYATTTDTATINGNLVNAAQSTPSSVQLTLTGPATAPASVTTMQVTPSSPVYGQTLTLTSTSSYRDGTGLKPPAGNVIFYIDSSTQVNATVDPATGIATATAPTLSAGNHQFYAVYSGTNGYTGSTSSTVNLTISQATPSITWAAPSAITYGTALSGTQLNASSTVAGTFAYTPALGTVLGAGPQTLSVTFTPTGTTNYTTATKTVSLTVTQVALTVTADNKSMTYGAAVPTLTGTLTGVVAGDGITASYATAATSNSTVRTYPITAALSDPNSKLGNYTVTNTPGTLTVTQATPVVSVWPTAGTITYGQTLTSSVLTGGAASVAGTFAFTAPTTAPNAGVYSAAAMFTPTDKTDYSTVQGTVSVTVRKAAQTINFTALATPVTLGTPAVTLVATGGASGNPVVYSVLSGPGAIAGNQLAYTGVGTVVVAADQTGNGNYAAATEVTESVVVNAATLGIGAASISFGSQPLGTTSQAQTLILTNTYGFPISVTSVQATGDYAAAANCPSVAAGGTCSIGVTFTPTATGTRTGTLTVANAESNATQTVTLTGVGTAAGIQITPTNVTFGSQVLNTASTGQTVTIVNTGTANLAISNIATTGDFATTGSCTTVPAGSNCNLTVVFTPVATGARTGTITLTDNAGGAGQTQVVILNGTGTLAGVTLSPSQQVFPSTLVGSTSFAQTVTLTNSGTAQLTGVGISTLGDFTQTNNCAAALSPSASCTISVQYAPTVGGAESGSLVVNDNLGQQTVTLAGTGLVPGASLSASQVIFGSQLVNSTSSAQTVVLTNTGTGSMTINSVQMPSYFSDTTNCTGTLAAGTSCSINVVFTPTITGPLSGTVTVTDSAGTQTFAVQGQGVSPGLSVTPSFVSFGAQAVGSIGQAQTLKVTNTGTVALTMNLIVASSNFVETDQCSGTLQPGASCLVSVYFAPSAMGSMTGSLTIGDVSGLVSTMVATSGVGTLPGIATSPAVISFGGVAVGTTSQAQTVTVTNTGNGPLQIGSIVGTGDFAEVDNCASQTIAAGAYCVINVTMTPTTTGARTGSIQIINSADGSHPIALSGLGQQANLTVTPTSLAFGSSPIVAASQAAAATGVTQSVVLKNTGSAAYTFGGLTMLGDFYETDNCGMVLAAGASCTVNVKFVPTALYHRTGSLTILDASGAVTQSVTLQGDGSPAGLIVSPSVLSFGTQHVGVTSAVQTSTLTNNTGASISNLSITASGEYNETNNCPSTLTSGASCTINVSVTPVLPGVVTGKLTISAGAVIVGGGRIATEFNLSALDSPNTGAISSTVGSIATQSTATTKQSGALAKLLFGVAPASNLTAGGNAGAGITVVEQDASGNAVTGADAITLLVSGPGSYTASYTVNAAGGQASFDLSGVTLTAPGSYTYTASIASAPAVTTATAMETVSVGAAAIVTATAGSGQSATIGTAFATPLTVKVTDAYGNVVSGASVSFTSPGSGASAVVTGSLATTDVSGVASVTVAANGSAGTYSVTATAGTGTAAFALTNAKATPTVTWATPAAITYGTALSATQLNATLSVAGTCVYTPTLGTVLAAGTQTLNATCTPADTADYTTATASVSLTVTKAAPTVTWATPAAITYGTVLSATQLNATASYNGSAVVGTFVYTPASGTVLAAGTQALSVTFTPTDTADYTMATANVTLTVNKGTPAIALVASQNPVMLLNAVSFTATVTAAGGTVPGTVSFYDGTTLLGTATLSSGVGVYTTSSLVAGTHSVTAVYTASANLNTVTSSAVPEVVQDFTMTVPSSGGSSGTVVPGGSTSFAFYFGSTTGTFAAPITFTASGLPTGATATFSPTTLSAPGTVVMTVTVPATQASVSRPSGLGKAAMPLALGVLLLPFARKWRRTGRRLQTLLVLVIVGLGSLGALIGMAGCGSSNGFFGQTPQNYIITVTATSGSLSHSTTVTLTVE